MIRVNLRFVQADRADFRRSDLTHYTAFAKDNRALANSFQTGDAVLFVSGGGNQLLFVFAATEVENRKGDKKVQALSSMRLRIVGSTWEPRMVANYAADNGIEIANRKRFESWFETQHA